MRDKSLIGPIPRVSTRAYLRTIMAPRVVSFIPPIYSPDILSIIGSSRDQLTPALSPSLRLYFFFFFSFLVQISCNNIVIFTPGFLRSLLTKPLTRACAVVAITMEWIYIPCSVDCSRAQLWKRFFKRKKIRVFEHRWPFSIARINKTIN